jgi:hypothetical protein
MIENLNAENTYNLLVLLRLLRCNLQHKLSGVLGDLERGMVEQNLSLTDSYINKLESNETRYQD